VSAYLDANVLLALLIQEPLTERADRCIGSTTGSVIVSDLASAEFASAVARRVQTREVTIEEARADLSDLDVWLVRCAQRVEIGAGDLMLATTYLRRLDLALLTPDAIHIAIAQRFGATLVTFDRQMAGCARALGYPVITP